MIIKTRALLTRLRQLAHTERGAVGMATLVAFIIAPILAGMVGLAAVSAMRLGGDLSTVFSRDTQMTQMVQRMQTQLTNVTELKVHDQYRFTAGDQPSKRSAYYMVPLGETLPEVCVTNTWELKPGTGGTRTLMNTQSTHRGDTCDSPVASTKTWELTGFTSATAFEYENTYGRDLHYASGAEKPDQSKNPRPDQLFDNEWFYASPGYVTIAGVLNQAIGETPLRATATTPLKQLRPGSVSSDLGELGPPAITRVHTGGDNYRADFTAVMNLPDPRVQVQWRWREAVNVPKDPITGALIPGSSWSSWSAWSGTAYRPDRPIGQGQKWYVEAQYRLVLDAQSTLSEVVRMEWVRPIDLPAPPATAISLQRPSSVPTSGNLNAGFQARITVTPAACPSGTTPEVRMRHALDGATMPSTYSTVDTSAPYQWTVPVAQGQRVTAEGQARCVSRFYPNDPVAELIPQPTPNIPGAWGWARNAGANQSATQPIVSAPTVGGVNAETTAPADRGIIGANLSGCPTGTRYQARAWYQLNEGSARTGTWQSTTTRVSLNAAAVREGERFDGNVQARCVSSYTTGPTGTGVEDQDVNPVRTAPRVTNPNAIIVGSTGRAAADVASCPTWLTYQARLVASVNGEAWGYGATTAAAAGRVARDSSRVIEQGYSFAGGISARCVSPYSQGPYAEARDTSPAVRPVAAPAAPTVSFTGQSPAARTVSFAISSPTCAPGTTLVLHQQARANAGTWEGWWRSSPQNARTVTGIGEGARLQVYARAQCDGRFADSAWTQSPLAETVQQIVTAPLVTNAAGTVSGTTGTGYADLGGCPTGTTYQARMYQRVNTATAEYGSFTAAAGGRQSRISPTVLRQGDQFAGGLAARCVSPYAQGPAARALDSTPVTLAITSRPTLRNLSVVSVNSGGLKGRISAEVSTPCPTHLATQVRFSRSTNAEARWTYQTGWAVQSPATTGASVWWAGLSIREGDRMLGGVEARCVSPYTTGSANGYEQYHTVGITSKPTLRNTMAYDSSGNGRFQGWISTPCPSHLTTQVAFYGARDYDAWATHRSGWLTQSSDGSGAHVWWAGVPINQGARWSASADVRCVSPYTQGAFNSYVHWNHYRPITSQPSANVYARVSQSSGNVYGGVSSIWGCPAGTTPRWKTNATGWRAGTGEVYDRWINYGQGATVYGALMCRSDFVNGPARSITYGYVFRNYPPPSSPSGVWTSGGASRSCDNTMWKANVSWGASSWVNYYEVYATWNNAGTRVGRNFGTTSATSRLLSGYFSGGTIGLNVQVRAHGPGGASGWSSAWIYQSGGCWN